MHRSVDEVIAALDHYYPSGPPNDQTVRGQQTYYLPKLWKDRWPTHLELPTVLRSDERALVTRDDLFRRARSITSADDAVDLYVRVCAWGTGTKARPVARCVKPLSQPAASNALLRSHRSVIGGDAESAYRRLHTWGEDRIKYFGPAFFTKWLYFSAYDSWQQEQGPPPLILDARVAKTLGWASTGWPASAYTQYLGIAKRIQQVWCPQRPLHVVEYALFKAGERSHD